MVGTRVPMRKRVNVPVPYKYTIPHSEGVDFHGVAVHSSLLGEPVGRLFEDPEVVKGSFRG